MDAIDNQCLEIRSGNLPQTSVTGDATCRWFTNGGGTWADCDSSTLTHPLSWQVRGGSCTAYDNPSCAYVFGESPDYTYLDGCHNYDASLPDLVNRKSILRAESSFVRVMIM